MATNTTNREVFTTEATSSELPIQTTDSSSESDGKLCSAMSKTSIRNQILTDQAYLSGGKNDVHAKTIYLSDSQVKVNNDQLANILGNKRAWLRRSLDIFVKTSGYDRSKTCLDKEGHVTVIGEAGSGKTDISLHLLRSHMPQFTPCIVDNVSELKSLCDPKVPTLVLANDVFGTSTFSQVQLQHWLQVLEQLQENLKTGKLKIIFNSRNYIFREAEPNLVVYKDSIFNENSIVDLSGDASLLPTEKMELLNIYCAEAGICLDEADLKTIVRMETNYGFPLACSRFSSTKSWHGRPVEFFKRPIEVVIESVQHLKTFDCEKFAVLLLVLLKDGTLNLAGLDKNDKVLETSQSLIKNADMTSFVRRRHQIAAPLIGSYLTSTGDTLSFRHPTVEDTVAYVVGNIDPLFLTEHCSMRVLYERVRIHSSRGEGSTQPTQPDTQWFHIILSDDYHDSLINRFVLEIENRNYSLLCLHQALTNERFVDRFVGRLKEINKMSIEFILHQKDLAHKRTLLSWSILNKTSLLCKKLAETKCRHLQQSICDALIVSCATGNSQAVEWVMNILNPTMKKRLEGKCLSTRGKIPIKMDENKIVIENGDFKGESILNIACLHGQRKVVTVLLQSGFAVNGHSSTHLRPIHCCCMVGDVDLLTYLCEQGADLDAKAFLGESPLHICCWNGNLLALKKCLELAAIKDSTEQREKSVLRAAIEAKDDFGLTPLMISCAGGYLPIVKHLTNCGADIEAVDEKGRTPLLTACENGRGHIVQYLIDLGANLDVQDRKGRVLLAYACEGGCEAFVDRVVKQQDVSLENSLKTTLLFSICKGKSFMSSGKCAMAQQLIDIGADVNDVNDDGMTPLLVAVGNGNRHLAHLLMDKGALLHVKDNQNQTLLHKAAEGNLPDIVRRGLTDAGRKRIGSTSDSPHCVSPSDDGLIREEKLDVNAVDGRRRTPLHIAAGVYFADGVVQVLLENKANVNAVDECGRTPLQIAAPTLLVDDTIKQLLANGADVNVKNHCKQTPLHQAAMNSYLSVPTVVALLKKEADVNSVDQNHQTPLHLASIWCEDTKVEVLLNYGTNVDAVDINMKTALHLAASSRKHTNNVKILVDYKANVNAADNRNQTPLHLASGIGNLENIEHLLEHGANVDARDDSQQTPLHLAARHGHTDCVLVLLDHDADVNATDENGKTPQQIAVPSDLGADTRQVFLDYAK